MWRSIKTTQNGIQETHQDDKWIVVKQSLKISYLSVIWEILWVTTKLKSGCVNYASFPNLVKFTHYFTKWYLGLDTHTHTHTHTHVLYQLPHFWGISISDYFKFQTADTSIRYRLPQTYNKMHKIVRFCQNYQIYYKDLVRFQVQGSKIIWFQYADSAIV